MDCSKRKKLEAKGWKVGTVQEFLGLSAEESALIELKLHLAERVRHRRKSLKLTQTALARRLKSSQSRVAKMEAGDPSVSLDLLVRSLLALRTSVRFLRKTLSF
jgi:ribosome-binding protein aMBF1 (putative translation factor)